MFYSISTPFENQQNMKEMKDFLTKHYRSITDIAAGLFDEKIQNEKINNTQPPDEIITSYNLGYKYQESTVEDERDYYFAICYWMAVRSGKKDRNGNPYVVYNGQENWTILIGQHLDEDDNQISVATNGYRKMKALTQVENLPISDLSGYSRDIFQALQKRWVKVNTIIHEELKRLTLLWDNKIIK